MKASEMWSSNPVNWGKVLFHDDRELLERIGVDKSELEDWIVGVRGSTLDWTGNGAGFELSLLVIDASSLLGSRWAEVDADRGLDE